MRFFLIGKLYIFSIFIITVSAQEKLAFQNPVNHDIILSGSFGEIRSTHFHAGIDIKPSQPKANDDIICSELGYISRIKVQRSGYGSALYIDHPNGYTTVYAHLSSFTPKIQQFVESIQRSAQSYEIEIYPQPGEFLIQKGETIGYLGNSGRSYGPHLHYEIRETVTEHPVNPMLFDIGPKDDIPPILSSIIIYGLSNTIKPIQRLTFGGKLLPKTLKIKAWRAGVGISGYDLMNGASNKNGIYQLSLFVDDSLYYRHILNEVSFDEMDQIKAHIDYKSKIENKGTYSLTYRLPGNKLSIIDSIKNDGIIKLYKDKARKIRVEAIDLNGNKTTLETNLVRDSQIIKKEKKTYNFLAKYDEVTSLLSDPIEISIPAYSLSNDEELSLQTQQINNEMLYSIGDETIPLINTARLTIQLDTNVIYLLEKLLLVNVEKDKITDYGSSINDHKITSIIHDFGQYKIYTDTIAPLIKPINLNQSIDGFYTFYLIDDVQTKGKAEDFTYDVYINDIWVACEYKEIVKTLYIPSSKYQLGDKLKITAEDQKGNIAIWQN